jgi:hypothetical protein
VSKAERTRGFDHKPAKGHLVRTSTEDRGAGQDEGCSIRGGRREKQDRKSRSSEKNFPKELKDIRKDISRAEIICRFTKKTVEGDQNVFFETVSLLEVYFSLQV